MKIYRNFSEIKQYWNSCQDYIRGCNHFMSQFLQDGVKEVYLAGLEVIPILINYCTIHYGQQTDVNYVLETNVPLLLKRSGEGVPNLDDVKNISKNQKQNEILNATVNIGTLGRKFGLKQLRQKGRSCFCLSLNLLKVEYNLVHSIQKKY